MGDGRRWAALQREVVLAWCLLVGGGWLTLTHYKTEPGPSGVAPPRWPGLASIASSQGQRTLILSLHPRCPCSRASLEELRLVLESSPGPLSCHVLVYRPRQAPPGWESTDLWQLAGSIPGVTRVVDEDGQMARRLGGLSSGDTVLYETDGTLLFHGGITGSRGHQGDNLGRRSLLELLRSRPAPSASSPVYGCPLTGRSSGARNP